MRKLFEKHKKLWSQKSFFLNVFLGMILFFISLFTTYYANIFTLAHASNTATDLLLDNLPVINVDFIFSEGALIFIAIVGLILFYEPRLIPFLIKSVALFILVRALFMILTHLAAPAEQSYRDTTELINRMSSGDDLFFSAHTGMPFLLALMFWEKKYFRYFFLFSTLVGASAVILGHLHYSIDVFSAFFISYGIFHIAKKIFYKDYKRFLAIETEI